MIKKTMLIIKKNITLVIGAALLAVSLFYVSNNPDLFTASVLSLQEKAFITEKGRDVAYKTNSGAVDIFVGEQITTPTTIIFTISFEKETITINPENLSGQGVRTILSSDENDITITANIDKDTDKTQSILLLPFSGDNKNILLSEAVATFGNDKEKNLSVGSLNETASHNK